MNSLTREKTSLFAGALFPSGKEPPGFQNHLREDADVALKARHSASFPLDDGELRNPKLLRKLAAGKPFIFPEFPDILG